MEDVLDGVHDESADVSVVHPDAVNQHEHDEDRPEDVEDAGQDVDLFVVEDDADVDWLILQIWIPFTPDDFFFSKILELRVCLLVCVSHDELNHIEASLMVLLLVPAVDQVYLCCLKIAFFLQVE